MQEVTDAVDHGHGAGVDVGSDAGRGEHLAQVAEEAETGDVGSRVHRVANFDRRVARAGVERGHHADRFVDERGAAASRFTAVEITPRPIGFVSTSASPTRCAARW